MVLIPATKHTLVFAILFAVALSLSNLVVLVFLFKLFVPHEGLLAHWNRRDPSSWTK